MVFLVFLHIFICIFLVAVILIQPGKSDAGVGFGSSSQSIFGSKGASNFLTKTTSICAFVFLLTSFVLTKDRIIAQRGLKISEDTSSIPKTSGSKAEDKSAAVPSATPAPTSTPPSGPKKK